MKIDVASARARAGSRYPNPFDEPCQNKTRRRLGLAAGLTQFGVNLLESGPGTWSSQRHWYAHEDEFVYVVRGPVVLVTDAGETMLDTGDCAGFKAGERDGPSPAEPGEATDLVLEVGTRDPAEPHAEYPDIDLRVTAQGYVRERRHAIFVASRRKSNAAARALQLQLSTEGRPPRSTAGCSSTEG
jgi:uncharacterized cupin superfamily protein